VTRTHLDRRQVRLWDVDHPNLYSLRTRLWKADGTLGDEPDVVGFGIRKIEARAGQLLLNGEPIRMGGANRHADLPAAAAEARRDAPSDREVCSACRG